MSESPRRRKTLRKAKIAKKQPAGPKLTFQWSVSALKWGTMPISSAAILPPIEIDRPRQQFTTNSRASTDRGSARKSVVSSQENFLLPDLKTRRQSQMSIGQDDLRQDTDSLPLMVSYAQVHRAPSPSLDKSPNHSSPSRGSFSSSKTSPRMKRKVSFASSTSMASESSISLSSVSKENRLSVNQLKKLEHSNRLQKNIGENEKLYSNTSRKNILPRVALTDMS